MARTRRPDQYRAIAAQTGATPPHPLQEAAA